MKRIVVGLALAALVATPVVAMMQKRAVSASALTPSLQARYKPGMSPKPRARTSPVLSSAAQRAADPRRKALLNVAAGKMSYALPRATYLASMAKAYEALDVQQDFKLLWQGPNPYEPLGPKVSSCLIVSYSFQPASKEKDPAHPGQYVEKPATYVPGDWLTWPEVLGSTAFEGGQCLATGYSEKTVCLIGGKTYEQQELETPPATGPLAGLGKSNPLAGIGAALACVQDLAACMAKPSYFEKLCTAHGGVLKPVVEYGGCEQWEQFGPDSREAFVKVAAVNFDAEDFNKDGVISGAEGKYLCKP